MNYVDFPETRVQMRRHSLSKSMALAFDRGLSLTLCAATDSAVGLLVYWRRRPSCDLNLNQIER